MSTEKDARSSRTCQPHHHEAAANHITVVREAAPKKTAREHCMHFAISVSGRAAVNECTSRRMHHRTGKHAVGTFRKRYEIVDGPDLSVSAKAGVTAQMSQRHVCVNGKKNKTPM